MFVVCTANESFQFGYKDFSRSEYKEILLARFLSSLRPRHMPVRATRQNALNVMESDDRAVTPTGEKQQKSGTDYVDHADTLQKRIHDDELLDVQNEPKRTCELAMK